MEFWGWLTGWWAVVEPRTDWVAIIVGFFATFASTVIAVVIALRLQRRDFDKRAAELQRQNELDAEQRRVELGERRRELEAQAATEARQRRDDWRRAIVSRAFELLNDAASFGRQPYLGGDRNPDERQARIQVAIDSMYMEFALDPEPEGRSVGEWYKRMTAEIMAVHVVPESTSGAIAGLAARVRFGLTEWANGEVTNESFATRAG